MPYINHVHNDDASWHITIPILLDVHPIPSGTPQYVDRHSLLISICPFFLFVYAHVIMHLIVRLWSWIMWSPTLSMIFFGFRSSTLFHWNNFKLSFLPMCTKSVKTWHTLTFEVFFNTCIM
jgi:hypothetical protein